MKNNCTVYIYIVKERCGYTMKKLTLLIVLTLVLVGCGKKEDTPKTPDVVTVASIVDGSAALEKSLSEEGNWITAITQDVTTDTALTVSGQFNNKGDKNEAVYRKLALHTQDDKFNITDNFTLTTEKLIVKSENFTVFYGNIKGDIVVSADGFSLVGTKVEGDIIFEKESYRESAQLDKDEKGAEVLGNITVSE